VDAAAADEGYPLIDEGDASAEFRLELARISGELIASGVVRTPPSVAASLELEIRLSGNSPPVIHRQGQGASDSFAEWGILLTRRALERATLPREWAGGRRLRYRLEGDAG
jgi:hypothetical protein